MIHILLDGEPQGPFTVDELRRLWEAGDVGGDALYWHRGMAGWRSVAEYKPPDQDSLRTQANAIKLTTTPSLANAEIETELDIITAECVVGMSIFHDFLTTLTDMAGGRSQTMQNALRRARVTCLAELRNEAHALAADAVIGVDLDYSEVSSQGKNMLFLVASGTAVRVRDVPPLPPV